LRNGQSKYIFKRALARILPDDILRRRKQGFNPPVDQWLRRELRELVQDSLLSQNAFVATLLQPAFVRQLVNEHLDGRRDHQRRLYTLLTLELWERQFIRGQSF
jgi:asparagine synthase (glutamine-hydrolysing)